MCRAAAPAVRLPTGELQLLRGGELVWTPHGQVPIERLELGQRVLTFTDAERLRFGWPPETPIDPETWRVVRASIDHGDGYAIDVALLRGPEWLRQHAPEAGAGFS